MYRQNRKVEKTTRRCEACFITVRKTIVCKTIARFGDNLNFEGLHQHSAPRLAVQWPVNSYAWLIQLDPHRQTMKLPIKLVLSTMCQLILKYF